jgi:hypothetical protein
MFRAIKEDRQDVLYQKKYTLKFKKCPKYGQISVEVLFLNNHKVTFALFKKSGNEDKRSKFELNLSLAFNLQFHGHPSL